MTSTNDNITTMHTTITPFDRTVQDAVRVTPLVRSKTARFEHSPVVLAMLTTTAPLRDCSSVREIYAECQATQSNDSICKTAASYFAACLNKDGM